MSRRVYVHAINKISESPDLAARYMRAGYSNATVRIREYADTAHRTCRVRRRNTRERTIFLFPWRRNEKWGEAGTVVRPHRKIMLSPR